MTIDALREICLSFPGVTEGVKWEDHLCFMVGEKMFCITGMQDDSHASIKVSEEDFDVLTERKGIEQARYFAKRKWIGIDKLSLLKKKEWQEYLRKSYELVLEGLPKKFRASLLG